MDHLDHLAAIAGDRGHLVGQLDSAGQEFVSRAVVALVRIGVAPEVLVERLPRMAHRTRRVLYRALGRGRDSSLSDALLPGVRQHFGDAEAARVLPYYSTGLVTEQLPELAYAAPNWQTLSRKHTDVVLSYLEDLAAAVAAHRSLCGHLRDPLPGSPARPRRARTRRVAAARSRCGTCSSTV
ncbi:hypothetical protein [Nocardia brasiliensis]|uniref:hypothetical protein n=1 Tax=Nocardia brasiliensis TaxID=37326 RepID=UPI003670321B